MNHIVHERGVSGQINSFFSSRQKQKSTKAPTDSFSFFFYYSPLELDGHDLSVAVGPKIRGEGGEGLRDLASAAHDVFRVELPPQPLLVQEVVAQGGDAQEALFAEGGREGGREGAHLVSNTFRSASFTAW